MDKILKKAIRFFRPVYWPIIKAYYLHLSPPTYGARIILTHKGEVLFVKNSYGLKYNFPGGGISKSEDPKDGIKREVKEELGLSLSDPKYITSLVPDIEYEYRKNTIYVFTAELAGKDVSISSLEIDEIKWFGVSNPPSMGHVAWQIFEIYKDYLNKNNL